MPSGSIVGFSRLVDGLADNLDASLTKHATFTNNAAPTITPTVAFPISVLVQPELSPSFLIL